MQGKYRSTRGGVSEERGEGVSEERGEGVSSLTSLAKFVVIIIVK